MAQKLRILPEPPPDVLLSIRNLLQNRDFVTLMEHRKNVLQELIYGSDSRIGAIDATGDDSERLRGAVHVLLDEKLLTDHIGSFIENARVKAKGY
jgi:hypothetical protein